MTDKNIYRKAYGNIRFDLFDPLPDAVFVLTLNGVLYVNQTAENLFSISSVPIPLPSFLTPVFRKIFFHDEEKDYENHIVYKNILYKLIIVQANSEAAIIQLSPQKNKSITHIDRDGILEAFLRLAPDPVLITDENGLIITCNQATSVFSADNDPKSLEGINSLKLLDTSEQPRIKEDIKTLLEEGSITGKEYKVSGNLKGILYIELSATTLRNEKNRIVILIIFKDITKRKIHENNLKNSELKFRQITESISEVCWLASKNNIIYVNPAFEDIWGYKAEAFLNNPFLLHDSLHPDDKSKLVNYTSLFGKKIKQQATLTSDQFRICRQDGEFRWLWIRIFPIFDNLGQLDRIVGLATDITRRIELEKSLKESEERFRSLITYSEDSYSVFTADGKLIYISPSITKLTGYSENEIRDTSIKTFIHEDDNEHVESGFLEAVTNKDITIRTEFRIRKKDGTFSYVESLISNQLNNPLINGIVIHSRNIDERKAAEQELFIAKERAELIYKVSPSAIFTVNKEKKITSWNNKAEEITGYTVDEVLNKPCVLFSQKPCQYECALFQQELNATLSSRECTIRTKNGEIKYISKNMDYLRDHSGQIIGGIESFTDITAEKKFLAEIIEAKERAEASDKLKSAFLANMSHEIRTPMNGILGFAELLRQSGVTEEEKIEYLDVISNSGNHLLNLINEIIDLSKIEAGQLKIVPTGFNLNLLIREIIKIFETQTERGNKKLKIVFIQNYQDQDTVILADKTRLRQIITNLINNAVKFTDQGMVSIDFGIKSENIHFHVRDTGIGIKPDEMKIIFNRFSQVDVSDSRKFGGTGLGLAIVKGLVELMKGEIKVESLPGQGSDFYFTVPYQSAHDEHRSVHDEHKNHFIHYNWKNKTFLIVEDDKMSYVFLKKILEKNKAEIIHCQDGLSAVEIISTRDNIDLVLMDIQLPGLNGLDATKKIKQIRPELPVIIQTANAMIENQMLCLAAGCDDYLTKPVDQSLLCVKINRLIHR